MADHFRVAAAVVAVATLARLAVLVLTPVPLSMDEAQYWIWSRDLAWGYFSKPPLLAWLVALTTSVCGDGEACVRLAAPIVHAATALVVFGIGHRLFDTRTGLWSAVLYILLPGISVSAMVASTDVPLLLFWALALYALVRVLDDPRPAWWGLLGLAGGLGLLSKYAMLFFLLCAAVLAIADRAARPVLLSRGGLGALVLALAIAAPNAAWNAANGFVSYRHVVDNMATTAPSLRPEEFFDFIGAQVGIFGPILFVILLVAGWTARKTRDRRMTLLAAFAWPVLVLIAGQALLSRAHANWAATAYIAAVVWVAWWGAQPSRVTWLRASVALHIVLAGVLYNFETLADATGVTLNRRIDPLVRVRGWDKAGDWSSALTAKYPGDGLLFDDRNTITELFYYTRPHPEIAVMWNPQRRAGNHFEMTTDLDRHSATPFLYFTRLPDARLVADAFDDVQPLGQWREVAYPGNELTLNVFRLTGFRGYSSPVRNR